MNLRTGLGTTLGFDDTLTMAPGGRFTTTFCGPPGFGVVTVFMVGVAGIATLVTTFFGAGFKR